MAANMYCNKCRKTMADNNFYTYKSGEKCELCKACLTMHINNFESDTFLWLLEKFDVPYIEAEWNVLRDRAYQKDPYKMNGMSVFGKYLSKMKLKQWKNFNWADSARLQAEAEEKAKLLGQPKEQQQAKMEAMEEAYKNGEITEAQWLTYKEITAPEPEFTVINGAVTNAAASAPGSPYPLNDNPFVEVDLPDVGADLTDEDKIYLATKWGRLYAAADWVYLEQKFNEYDESFDLHNADLLAGTLQLCKLDLKCNQALDTGDIDSYSKLARASDALRKSLKFTEAQRKEDKSGEFSCYGQIVAFAEKNNDEDFIRPIDLSVDRDIVDADIRIMKKWNQQLIEDDPAVFKLIEQYIKKREALAEQEADQAAALEAGDTEYQLTDEDLADFNNSLEEQRKEDLSLLFDEGDEQEEDE